MGPLRGPGSKGSEGSKGSKGCGGALRAPICIKPLQPGFARWQTIQPHLSVSRLKGRPFYGQAMGQLRLTCTFSAECAQRVEMHPLLPPAAASPPKGETTHYILRVAGAPSKCVRCASTGKLLTRFSVTCGSLQHGYHRLTGFSGLFCSPTNPVRWCDSCSLATPEGEILAALCLDVLMRPKAERRANFPLRGGKGTGFVGEQSDPKIQ